MGKAEGRGKDWHGHVTAVTVAPEYRRIGLAKKLMYILEEVSEKMYFLSCCGPFETSSTHIMTIGTMGTL
jgi:ribosomal protein S18 acetylase RimI-like enzyme